MLPKTIDPPPPDKRPWYEYLEIPPGKIITAVSISNRVLGFATHFTDKRTRPCLLPGCPCPYHDEPGEVRWVGYLLVWAAYANAVQRLQLTRGAFQNCPAMPKLQGSLRGMTLRVNRMGATKNSPMRIVVSDPEEFPGKTAFLPQCRLLQHLERIWGLGDEPGNGTGQPGADGADLMGEDQS